MALFLKRRPIFIKFVLAMTTMIVLAMISIDHNETKDNNMIVVQEEDNSSIGSKCKYEISSISDAVTVLSRHLEQRRIWPRIRHCSKFTISHMIPKCRQPIALASFPGSGNTWLRQMVEEASGIFTGSRYKDLQLQLQGFYGEARVWNDGSTLLQKTHDASRHHVQEDFGGRAVLLLRNPYTSLLSVHNYLYGGHRGLAPLADFEREEWPRFVSQQMHKWLHMATNFIVFSEKLLIVHYELLRTDPENQLRRILHFLRIPIDEQRLQCLSASKTPFRRTFRHKDINKVWLKAFPSHLRVHIDRIIGDLDRLLSKKGHGKLPLELYDVFNRTDQQLLRQTPMQYGHTNNDDNVNDDEEDQLEDVDKAKGAILVLDELIAWGEDHPEQSTTLFGPSLLRHLRLQLNHSASSGRTLKMVLKMLEAWPLLKRPFLKTDPLLEALQEGPGGDLSHLTINHENF